MDVLMLSRIQFAVTVAFHYIYPPLSIGLGMILVMLEGAYLVTKKRVYLESARFWTKIFALTFSVGVATGVVMEFEFGTNWATYSRFVGDVFGSPLAAEAIFAFFLEGVFLGVLLFGWNRLKPAWHFFATLMVCLGAHLSALWIVVAGSWMQTPAGFHIVEKGGHMRAEITDFWAMVFNPSMPVRYTHVVMGCWQAGAFLVLGVSAYHLLKRRHIDTARVSLTTALILGLVASLGQGMSGHASAMVVGKYQPAKMAAFEGHFPAHAPAALVLFGWVDESGKRVHGPRIPGLLSLLLHGDPKAPVTGLEAFRPEDRPPVQAVFQTYHLMVAIGVGLLVLLLWSVRLLWRGRLFTHAPTLKLLTASAILPQLGNQLGWMSAEIGRQPWIVYGLLRTSEGLSKVVRAETVLSSLILFTIIYTLLFAFFLYELFRKIQAGPEGPAATKGGAR